METLLVVAMACLSIGSLVCAIMIALEMYEEKGALSTFLGFCICQLYLYIWGWTSSNDPKRRTIMIVWTLLIVINLVVSLVGRTAFGIGANAGP